MAGTALSEAEQARVETILQEMSVEEKVSLIAGVSMWTTAPIERLGVPAIKVSDGPNGARGGGGFVGGAVSSACFPVGISLASTWNTALIEQIGIALAEETKSKGAHMLLAPTVNIHRSPLNGRNFECYSEDPHLSARIAVAYINGLQSQGIGATVKHFVCNDSEFERNTISSEVDERTMREIYLPPFQAAVQEAGSWGVMSSYNKVNGIFAGENAAILRDILKEEWGFDGIVMSDWFGTKSTADAVNNGLDLEMPGPPQWRGQRLLAAIAAGEIDMDALDDAARRMLRTITRAGAFESPELQPEQSIDKPEHRALLRAAAAEGIVLLKNSGILPLDPQRMTSIAMIGPNARTAAIMGGGSAQVNAHYAISPFEGVVAQAGEQLELGYAIGCTNHKQLPRLDAGLIQAGDAGQPGLTISFYEGHDLAGEPIHLAQTTSTEQVWFGQLAPGIAPKQFSATIVGQVVPQETGAQIFGLASAGRSRLLINGALVIDNWSTQTRGDTYFGTGSSEVVAHVEMVAGERYELRIEYANQGATLLAGVRLGHLPPVGADSIARAAALAARSDAAVLFVGLNGDWESEGHDRPDMELAGDQVALIEQVAAANPNTIVVLQTGSPVRMPWVDKVAGVLQAWFPGQECGNAIADVLFGRVNPSGKLPQTFPVRLEDNPAFINYPGENGRVRYGEGIYVGYRYYEKKRVAPLFPFGFGLSYTTFRYGDLRLSADAIAPDEQLTATIAITNTGERAGQEIVQLYVRDVDARVARPEKELRAFAKVALAPGETREVSLTIDRTGLAFWDDAEHCWVAEAGAFEALVGSSSQDIHARASFELTQSVAFGGPARPPVLLTVESSVKALLASDAARAVIERHLPGFAEGANMALALGLTLVQVAGFAPDQISAERLEAIAADLAALS
jgi:beta-glucosidase